MPSLTFVSDSGAIHVRVTKKEYALFNFLANDAYRIFSHEEIWQGVWGFVPVIATRALSMQIYGLRTKLKAAGIDGMVVTHWNAGYSLRG